MSNWYLEAHCSSCGGQLATNGKITWCTINKCQNYAREEIEYDGTNSHESIHKEGQKVSDIK